jgi:Ca2+/Na+ antiporter
MWRDPGVNWWQAKVILKYIMLFVLFIKYTYSQTCVQRPPLGPEKSGRLKEGTDKSEI